jgi:hypothetical protein
MRRREFSGDFSSVRVVRRAAAIPILLISAPSYRPTLDWSSVLRTLQRRIDEPVHRRRDAVTVPKFDHLAREPRQLEPVAAEQVIAHRGGVMWRHRAHHSERLLGEVGWQPDPLGEPDRDGFARGRFIEGQEVGIAAPLSERQPGQRMEPPSGTSMTNFSQTGTMISGLNMPSNPAASQRSRRC